MTSRRSAFFNRSSVSANGTEPKAGTTQVGVPLPPTPKSMTVLQDQLKKGSISHPGALSAVVDLIRNTESIDDRKLLLEHAIMFVSKMEEGPLATAAKNKIIQLLYNDLMHPPATSIGPKYAWRTADGSCNNPDLPDMGKAGTPYARSVQQSHPLPKDQLPDPGLVFDTLLRREGFVKHPGGLSSLMFSFAALVIHSVFRTSHSDNNINETSSYVDLAPLYGHNLESQQRVRAYDGFGLLHPDCFAEDRLLLLPPATCTLLVLFSRNHNYIAKKIYEINERGNYDDPSKLTPDKFAEQDEELFQTARLVNCGWFGMVVFSDYFSSILGLVRHGSSWSLTPFDEIRQDDHSLYERGKGNVCSVEFNCLYRWHATTSQEDEAWTHTAFQHVFGDKDPNSVTPDDFKAAARRLQAAQPDITKWTFGGLKRQSDGKFRDEDLATVLHDATEHPAGAFRARGTPAIMRLHEIMGIEQNRRWGVCSLNDFRKYLGLKPYKTFLEWNSNPEIADAAEKLYGDIQNLELYVGLQAEEAKPLVDGAGLCPGYTISRAILSDAIALTRGDRFFTHDFTPYNLTAWGFADCQRDPSAFGFGSTLARLFLRTLPNHFSDNGVYTFFPLMTPDVMETNLKKLGVIDQYDLSRPKPKDQVQTFAEHEDVSAILDSQDFKTVYNEYASRVIKGAGFYPAEDGRKQTAITSALSSSSELLNNIGQYFYDTTQRLIVENSFGLVGGKTFGVDIVQHVLRLLPVYWAASDLAGIQLKTKGNSSGVYTPQELFEILSDIYSFIFLEVEPAKLRVLQKKVEGDVKELLHVISTHLGVGSRLSIANLVGSVSGWFSRSKRTTEHREIVKKLREVSNSTDELANIILAIMVSSLNLSLALTNVVDRYLGGEKDAELKRFVQAKDPHALAGFIYEALRLDPPFSGVFRISTKDQSRGSRSLKKGERVFLDIARANLNDSIFPKPSAIEPARDASKCLFSDGSFKYLGEDLSIKVIIEVIRAIYAYNNVRRAPGQSGKLKRFVDYGHRQYRFAYLDRTQHISPWPTSMTVQYDV